MTANQLKKAILKANINLNGLTFEKNCIEICIDYKEINGFGDCNQVKTKRVLNQIKKIFPSWSSVTSTGYGAKRLNFDFVPCELVRNNID